MRPTMTGSETLDIVLCIILAIAAYIAGHLLDHWVKIWSLTLEPMSELKRKLLVLRENRNELELYAMKKKRMTREKAEALFFEYEYRLERAIEIKERKQAKGGPKQWP